MKKTGKQIGGLLPLWRSVYRLALIACIGGMPMSTGLAASLDEGRPAPAFEIRTLDGRSIDSANTKGKVVLLHFWATWCPPCREEMPALDKFYREHRKEGLEIVAISIEDAADAAAVRDAAKQYSYPAALISQAKIEGYGRIWRIPLSYVIDRNGVLRKSDWSGDQKIDAASLEQFVRPLLN